MRMQHRVDPPLVDYPFRGKNDRRHDDGWKCRGRGDRHKRSAGSRFRDEHPSFSRVAIETFIIFVI